MAQGIQNKRSPKGTKNRKTVLLQERGARRWPKCSERTPSTAMLIRSQSRFYKDGSMAIGLHLDAAKVAMRYEKPALTAVEHSNRLDTRLASELTDDELAAIAAGGLSSSNQAPVDPT
jgi:hypothetical protein